MSGSTEAGLSTSLRSGRDDRVEVRKREESQMISFSVSRVHSVPQAKNPSIAGCFASESLRGVSVEDQDVVPFGSLLQGELWLRLPCGLSSL